LMDTLDANKNPLLDGKGVNKRSELR
jgi:hypothetical protein